MLLTTCVAGASSVPLSDLKAYPPDIALFTAHSRQRVVVQATDAEGVTREVTAQARYTLGDPKLARFEQGVLYPLADGKTELRITYQDPSASNSQLSLALPVTVSNAAARLPVSFKLDVMPIFTKAGCNSGGCHGTSRGKDGFHLSLFGFDPDGDYHRLTREQIGRRINPAIPEESLIVQKGLGAVQHTGGVRFPTNSELYTNLVAWLTAGATNDPPAVAKVTAIDIFPKSAVLEGSNAVQHFLVRAYHSDGTQRDVTSLAVFLSNNEVSARVAEDGMVTAGQRGEAFIQARFGEFNAGAQVIVIPKDL